MNKPEIGICFSEIGHTHHIIVYGLPNYYWVGRFLMAFLEKHWRAVWLLNRTCCERKRPPP